MRKLTTLLGMGLVVVAVACGGQEQGMDQMDEMEPSSEMMSEPTDSVMPDSMQGRSDDMMDDQGGMDQGGMDDDAMGGGA